MSNPTCYPIVDWISFTVPSPQDRRTGAPAWMFPNDSKLLAKEAMGRVGKVIGQQAMNTLFSGMDYGLDNGRMPYRYSMQDAVSRATVFFDSGVNHVLVEVSGLGCTELRKKDITQFAVGLLAGRITRLDLSMDIFTLVTPVEWLARGYNRRLRSSGILTSDTGQTCYLGSPKSEARAAVYRYYPPHPRSEYLRIEHRFKGAKARQMANYLGKTSTEEAVAYAGVLFDWGHEFWPGLVESTAPLPDFTVGARDQNTVNWLLRQVFPAMRKAERDGRIEDLKGFVHEYLFDDHGEELEYVDADGIAHSL